MFLFILYLHIINIWGGDFLGINPQTMKKYLLNCSGLKLPISNDHYITGKDIYTFSNLVCIENTLSNFTNNCKCIIKNIHCKR